MRSKNGPGGRSSELDQLTLRLTSDLTGVLTSAARSVPSGQLALLGPLPAAARNSNLTKLERGVSSCCFLLTLTLVDL